MDNNNQALGVGHGMGQLLESTRNQISSTNLRIEDLYRFINTFSPSSSNFEHRTAAGRAFAELTTLLKLDK